jgi:hypothetical protein
MTTTSEFDAAIDRVLSRSNRPRGVTVRVTDPLPRYFGFAASNKGDGSIPVRKSLLSGSARMRGASVRPGEPGARPPIGARKRTRHTS